MSQDYPSAVPEASTEFLLFSNKINLKLDSGNFSEVQLIIYPSPVGFIEGERAEYITYILATVRVSCVLCVSRVIPGRYLLPAGREPYRA